ncbi:MAG TPA: hypothetical protein VFY89_11030 [Ktedonobacterales bacterium]
MMCWPGSHKTIGAMPSFEERVWREARRRCPHGVPAALLVIRALVEAPADQAAARALASLAEELRPLLRRGDAIIVEAARGIAVVLVGARQSGARAVAHRLCAGCAALTPAPGVPTRTITLGLGYSGLSPLRPLDRWHADGALRAAHHVRLSLRVAWPIAAEDPAHTEREAALETPRLRLIRTGGRRQDERLPALAERGTRRLAVGAPLTPPLPAAMDGERPARGQVLTLSVSASARAGAVVEISDTRDRLRLRALSLGVPFLHLPPTLPLDCAGALPMELARALRAVPVGRTATALTVALDTRWDARTLFRLRAATGLEIFPVLTQPDELERALAQLARWG